MGEYALSKDLNVALWLDYRSFNKEKLLKEVYDGDFLIIDEQLHAQFDEFKQKFVPANHSMVRKLNLIDHYLSTKGKFCVSNCVELYGKLYVVLNSVQMDDFCQWIYDSRENDGDIFYLGKWYFVI